METQNERWAELKELESWLRTPMLVLSFVWLIIVVLDLVGKSNPLLTTIGTVIWGVFILEFLIRFALAPKKRPFLRSNWLTLIALAVPALRLVRIFAFLRFARLLRGLRLVRIVGTANRGMKALRTALARRQFGYVAGLTMLVLVLGAAGMLSFEPAGQVAGGFATYWDALWWTAMLLTSIGSEYWPTTSEGRILCVLLAVYGFAVFGYLAATLASFFIGRDAEAPSGPVAGSGEIESLRQEIAALRHALEQSGRIDRQGSAPEGSA